jgi:hypothetical protein
MNTIPAIKPTEREAILQSLRAGVVPRRGQQHIQVGRQTELQMLIRDVEHVNGGGACVRFIIGPYGSGKTFFLSLLRSIALEKKLVTAHADLSPERRLYSTGGHARTLYAELMRNLATRSRPDGGALPGVVERFVTSAISDATARGVTPTTVISERMGLLSEMVGGYDFAQVIECYWRAHDTGDEILKSNAIRWLRAEYSAKSDARHALGVRTIIDDENVYDHLKLMARFVRLGGYGGLMICLDEMVNLYKLANGRARNTNYEQILRIVNDCLQGVAEGLGIVFGGTPEFMTDARRGLYSYPALQSRLAENTFTRDGIVDHSGPVVRLSNLTQEDLYVLLEKLRHVYACGEESKYLLPNDALRAFMGHCFQRVGESYFRTPRNTIKEFVNLMSILEQNPGVKWSDLIENVEVVVESNSDAEPLPEDVDDAPEGAAPQGAKPDGGAADDDLTSFRL